jgi:predicted unusual protein kinase regulating ubiquinone biosynthesis (AarF/ABC1/UbiB family)
MLGRTIAILSGMCTGLDPQFNFWASLAPYATKLVTDEGESGWETLLAEGQKVLQTAIGLPGRADRVLTLVERGELGVQTPLLNLRVRGVERAVSRIPRALVFAGLLIAGAILYPAEPTLAKVLMWLSVLPGLGALMGGRGRHPGR